MSHDHLHDLRSFELQRALRWFPAAVAHDRHPVRVLELGAGTGHQAAELSRLGYDVVAVDLPTSAYAVCRVHPVVDYDGVRLPFADQSFDVVFSSNVLEHIASLDRSLEEIARVLAPSGVTIHILPTPAWRIWTTVVHPVWVMKRVTMLHPKRPVMPQQPLEGTDQVGGWISRWRSALPARHGERGNFMSEIGYFSARWWRGAFADAGFRVREDRVAGLFYTGCSILGAKLPIAYRARLSRAFGSACRVFLLTADRDSR